MSKSIKEVVKECEKLKLTAEAKLVYLCENSKNFKDGKSLRSLWIYGLECLSNFDIFSAKIDVTELVITYSPITEYELALMMQKRILKNHKTKEKWQTRYKWFIHDSNKITMINDDINATSLDTIMYLTASLKHYDLDVKNIRLLRNICDVAMNYFALENLSITALDASSYLHNFINFLDSEKSYVRPMIITDADKVDTHKIQKIFIQVIKKYLKRWHTESKIVPILSMISSQIEDDKKIEETIHFFIEYLSQYERSFLMSLLSLTSDCKELELSYDRLKYDFISKQFFYELNIKTQLFASQRCEKTKKMILLTLNYLQSKDVYILPEEEQWVFPSISITNSRGKNIFSKIAFCSKVHLSIQGKNQLYSNTMDKIQKFEAGPEFILSLKDYNPFMSWCGVCVGEYHKVCDQKNKCNASFDKETNLTYRDNTLACIEGREKQLYGCIYYKNEENEEKDDYTKAHNNKEDKLLLKMKYENHLKQIEEKKKVLEECNNTVSTYKPYTPFDELQEAMDMYDWGHDPYNNLRYWWW